MFVPKRAAGAAFSSKARTSTSASSTARPQATKKAATDALFNLETYIQKRDFVGAITLLGLQQQQEQQQRSERSSGNAMSEPQDRLDTWRMTTWWLAYCHFQCGDYARALEYFDHLLQSTKAAPTGSASAHAADDDAWRLGRACCLYYLRQFEDAEQAALGTKRHALCNRLLYLIAHCRQHGEQVLLDRYQQLSSSSPEDSLALAFTSFTQRNFQESIEIYKRLLQQHTRDELSAVHVYLAMCYFKADYYDVALELIAVYLATHPDSFFASNVKACSQYRLYSGYEGTSVLEEFKRTYPRHPCAQPSRGSAATPDIFDCTGMRDVAAHNAVVFREASGGASGNSTTTAAVATLQPLVGVIDEAQLNLVLCFLQHREYEQAFALVEDLEPKTPSEHVIKGILHGVIGEETHSKEHVFLAEKHFHAVGSSPEEADTIPGRQAMASYYILRKEFEDANVYLSSIAQYLCASDAFNWNYGISLAAVGNYAEAEEVLLRVQSERLKTQLTLCSWLARCYIYNRKNASSVWELYLKMENTSDAYKLLKLIANDYYAVKHYYYAVKAFDVLERLDPDPEYWEAKRGACVGFYQQIATGTALFDAHQSDDVLKLLLHSKNALEASKLAAVLKKWILSTVSTQRSAPSDSGGAARSSSK